MQSKQLCTVKVKGKAFRLNKSSLIQKQMQFSLNSKHQDRHIYRKTKHTKQQGWNKENDNPTDVKEHAVSAIGKDNISC